MSSTGADAPTSASAPSAGVLALDPSALVERYVPSENRSLVCDAMEEADVWCISDLARTELLLALHRLAGDRYTAADLAAAARADIDAMVVVPVDEQCLARAVDIGNTYGLRTVDAVHLAAIDRLPRPLRYATLDRRQIPAALALGLDVVAPTEQMN